MLLIKNGNRSLEVRKVQFLINHLSDPSPKLAEDGIFGPMTHQAVVNFQRSRNLSADGIVGPITCKAILRAMGSRIGRS